MHLQYVKHKEIFSKVERLYINFCTWHLSSELKSEEQTARSGIYTLAASVQGQLFIHRPRHTGR